MDRVQDLELTDDSRKVIKDILKSKDKESKGYVTVDELGDCLEAFGFNPDDEDLEFLVKHMDDNGDGHLEAEEILENIDVINWHCFYGKELMKEFRSIDTDGDRVIRFPEMLKVFVTRGPEPMEPLKARQLLDKLARKFDANFDGKFNYTEFVKIYMSDMLPFKAAIESGTFIGGHAVENGHDKPKSAKPKKKKIVKKKSDLPPEPVKQVNIPFSRNPRTGEASGVRPRTAGVTHPSSTSRPRTAGRNLSKSSMHSVKLHSEKT